MRTSQNASCYHMFVAAVRPVLWRINNLRLFAIKPTELAHNLPPQSFNNKQTNSLHYLQFLSSYENPSVFNITARN